MITFNETRAPTSGKHVADQGIVMPNWLKTRLTFWWLSSVFAVEKQPKNLNFHSVFTSKRLFGGCFQWNDCTSFQKICSWTRYCDAKLINNMPNFLVALLRFCFRKIFLKCKFSQCFYLQETLWCILSMKRVHLLPENM